MALVDASAASVSAANQTTDALALEATRSDPQLVLPQVGLSSTAQAQEIRAWLAHKLTDIWSWSGEWAPTTYPDNSPHAGDDVMFEPDRTVAADDPSQFYTVVLDIDTPALKSVTFTNPHATLAIGESGGAAHSLLVSGTSEYAINLGAAHITMVPGSTITDYGGFSLGLGSLTGAGTVQIASHIFGAGTIKASGGTLDVFGTIDLGVRLAVDTASPSQLKLHGATTLSDPVSLTSGNQTLWIGNTATIGLPLEVAGGAHLVMHGGTLNDRFALKLTSGDLTGFGVLNADADLGSNSPHVFVSGGVLDFAGKVTWRGHPTFHIAADSTLEFGGPVLGQFGDERVQVSFEGTNTLLDLSHTLLDNFHGTVNSLSAGQAIKVANAASVTLDQSHTHLSVLDASGNALGTIAFASAQTNKTFAVNEHGEIFVQGPPSSTAELPLVGQSQTDFTDMAY